MTNLTIIYEYKYGLSQSFSYNYHDLCGMADKQAAVLLPSFDSMLNVATARIVLMNSTGTYRRNFLSLLFVVVIETLS